MENNTPASTAKNKKRAVLALLLILLLAGSSIGLNRFAAENKTPSQSLETIENTDTPLAAAPETEEVVSPVTPLAAVQNTAAAPVVITPLPVVQPSVPDVQPEVPAETPDPELPKEDLPAEELPEEGSKEETPVYATQLEKVVAAAKQITDGFNALETEADRRAYLGITNNNMSNDTFRNLLATSAILPVEEDKMPLMDGSTDRFLQAYFVSNGTNVKTSFIYLSAADCLNGASGDKWKAFSIYLPEENLWFDSISTHPYNGSLQANNISGFANKSYDEVKTLLNSETTLWALREEPAAPALGEEEAAPANEVSFASAPVEEAPAEEAVLEEAAPVEEAPAEPADEEPAGEEAAAPAAEAVL